jgi:hypothetical protein
VNVLCRSICLSLLLSLRNTGQAVLHFGNAADIYFLKTPAGIFTLYGRVCRPNALGCRVRKASIDYDHCDSFTGDRCHRGKR